MKIKLVSLMIALVFLAACAEQPEQDPDSNNNHVETKTEESEPIKENDKDTVIEFPNELLQKLDEGDSVLQLQKALKTCGDMSRVK